MKWLFYLICWSGLMASETYKPLDHPAQLERKIRGFSEPCASLKIRSENSARLLSFHYKEGQVLSSTDGSRPLIASQDSKFSELDLKAVQTSIESDQAQLAIQKSKLASQERLIQYKKLELDRISPLAKEGKIAQSLLDRAMFEFDQARLKAKEFQAQLLLQENTLKEALVRKQVSQERLDRFQITGPSGWLLNKYLVEPGTWLNPGDPICELVDLRQLSLYFRLSEKELSTLREQGIQLWSLKEKRFVKATIHHIDLNFDQNSRKQLLELRIISDQLKKASGGQEFELQIKIDYPRPTVLIPEKFLFKKLARHYVRLQDGSDLAINPLRKVDGQYVVDGEVFSAETVLKPID